MQKQKGFASILIILLIALAVGGYFIYTNQQKPVSVPQQAAQPSSTSSGETANRKTYENKASGYAIKYPADLYLQDLGTKVIFTTQPFEKGFLPPFERVEINKDGNYRNQEFDALYKASKGDDVIEAHHASGVKVTKLQNTKFGNFTAVEYIRDGTIFPAGQGGRGEIGYEHRVLIKKNNDQFIEISNISTSADKIMEKDAIFNTILSTFKFTN